MIGLPGTASICVVGPSGVEYRAALPDAIRAAYIARLPPVVEGEVRSFNRRTDVQLTMLNAFGAVYDRATDVVRDSFYAAIGRGEMTREAANYWDGHAVNSAMAGAGLLSYSARGLADMPPFVRAVIDGATNQARATRQDYPVLREPARVPAGWHIFRTAKRFLKRVTKYREDQPRVPAGSPEGGQWAGWDASMGLSAKMPENTPIWFSYGIGRGEIARNATPHVAVRMLRDQMKDQRTGLGNLTTGSYDLRGVMVHDRQTGAEDFYIAPAMTFIHNDFTALLGGRNDERRAVVAFMLTWNRATQSFEFGGSYNLSWSLSPLMDHNIDPDLTNRSWVQRMLRPGLAKRFMERVAKRDWNPDLHPREPRGTPQGGWFTVAENDAVVPSFRAFEAANPRLSGNALFRGFLRSQDSEHMIAVDTHGRVVGVSTSRDWMTVNPNPAMMSSMRDRSQRLTIWHNQPLGGSFSDVDVRLLGEPGVARLHLVTPHYEYTLALKQPITVVSRAYARAMQAVQAALMAAVARGQLDAGDVDQIAPHLTLLALAQDGYVEYGSDVPAFSLTASVVAAGASAAGGAP